STHAEQSFTTERPSRYSLPNSRLSTKTLNCTCVSLNHLKGYITDKSAVRSSDLNRTGGRTCGQLCNDLGRSTATECRCDSVKGKAGCAGQVGSQNPDISSNLARGRNGFNKRAEAHAQAENGAIPVGAAGIGCSVKVPVGGLDQPSKGVGAIAAVKIVDL